MDSVSFLHPFFAGNYQLRLFINYTMEGLTDSNGKAVELETYCNQAFKYVAKEKPSMRVYDSGVTTSDRTVDAQVQLVKGVCHLHIRRTHLYGI